MVCDQDCFNCKFPDCVFTKDKEYYQKNKEKIAERHRQYYQKNKKKSQNLAI